MISLSVSSFLSPWCVRSGSRCRFIDVAFKRCSDKKKRLEGGAVEKGNLDYRWRSGTMDLAGHRSNIALRSASRVVREGGKERSDGLEGI